MPAEPKFVAPAYATDPMCGDALAFWKQVYLALLGRGLAGSAAAIGADEAALEYVERGKALGRNRFAPRRVPEDPAPPKA